MQLHISSLPDSREGGGRISVFTAHKGTIKRALTNYLGSSAPLCYLLGFRKFFLKPELDSRKGWLWREKDLDNSLYISGQERGRDREGDTMGLLLPAPCPTTLRFAHCTCLGEKQAHISVQELLKVLPENLFKGISHWQSKQQKRIVCSTLLW